MCTENRVLLFEENWIFKAVVSWNLILFDFSGLTFGKSKKNFDEIDRAGFGRFVKRPAKKNFDEIDNVGFRGFAKKNFDEIDNVGFRGFAKKNFDEIDNVGFRGF